MCFGVIAWLFYEELQKKEMTSYQKKIVTGIEGGITILFFYGILFHKSSIATLFSLLLLLPIMVAIIFSEKSYFVRFFQYKWMKKMDSISFSIYLNHAVARRIVNEYWKEISYWSGMAVFVFLILVFCMIHFLLVKWILFLWNRKRK